MLQEIDLSILADQIRQLQESVYFNENIRPYCAALADGVVALKNSKLAPILLGQIVDDFWASLKYVSGSTSNEIPYEMQYCLGLVLVDWNISDCIITTALSPNRGDFHFYQIDPWQNFDKVLPPILGRKKLIQISLPRMYRNHPLLNVALYHEVGHYIDVSNALIEASLLLNGGVIALSAADIAATKPPLSAAQIAAIERNHRKEFFADLVAASYVGESSVRYLQECDLGNFVSATHPQTSKRVELTKKFLNGESEPIISLFSDSLKARALPALTKKHTLPCVDYSFNDFRPLEIETNEQVHGVFPAAWSFFDKRRSVNTAWADLDDARAFALVNDLTEKSIRNFDIAAKWKNVASI